MADARTDQRPGRRRATPEPRPSRRRAHRPAVPATPVDTGPQRSLRIDPDSRTGHDLETPEPSPPPKPPRARRWTRWLVRVLWVVLTLGGLAACVSAWTSLEVPDVTPTVGAVVLTTTLSFALAVRTGGRPLVVAVAAAALAAGAVVSDLPVLVAAVAVSTAVIGAVLGVMVTTPAARFPGVVRECLLAVLVAVVASFAVDAFDAQVSPMRAGYLVLGLSLLGALALAYRLAAGLHGLGRRGLVMVVTGVGLLAVSLAYTQALATWGSPELRGSFDDATRMLRDTVGAVPRPVEFLLGIPALAWGVSTRARRRQGWWGTAFGASGLAVVTVTLLDPDLSLVEAGLRTAYSLVVGLLLGYLLIRADRFFSGARGRRARRLEEAAAHRPEPGRTHPLL